MIVRKGLIRGYGSKVGLPVALNLKLITRHGKVVSYFQKLIKFLITRLLIKLLNHIEVPYRKSSLKFERPKSIIISRRRKLIKLPTESRSFRTKFLSLPPTM